ncbi:MAG: ATP-binding protein [Proteobacteria bacterium]|nr:ATP-binding protein [Pseudomonadota bacterium]
MSDVKNNLSLDRVVIKNYRKLKETDIKLNNIYSIIVGKNNTGKTSILSALDSFINKKNFKIYDISLIECLELIKIKNGYERELCIEESCIKN